MPITAARPEDGGSQVVVLVMGGPRGSVLAGGITHLVATGAGGGGALATGAAAEVLIVPVLGGPHRAPLHQVVDLLGVQGLVLHQRILHGVEDIDVVFENLLGPVVTVFDNGPHLGVDFLGDGS